MYSTYRVAGKVVTKKQHLKTSGRKEKKKKEIIKDELPSTELWNMRAEQTGNRRGVVGWVTPRWMSVRNRDIRIFNQEETRFVYFPSPSHIHFRIDGQVLVLNHKTEILASKL